MKKYETFLAAFVTLGLLALLVVIIPVNWKVFGDPEYINSLHRFSYFKSVVRLNFPQNTPF